MPPERQNKEKVSDPEEEGPEEREEVISGFFPDLLRRGLTLGFTGLFLTEEAMRKVFGDSVPREWIQFVLTQSDRTRTELVDRLSREFGRVMSALDPVDVLRRLFDGQTIEVSAKVRFASSDGPGPGARARVRMGREQEGTDEPEADEGA